jgi:hypothetical protein
MKSNISQSVRTRIFAMLALVATLAFTPVVVFAADKVAHEERVEMRVNEMHNKLAITAVQEEQWGKVKQIMLDDAINMDKLTHARAEHEKEMNAVDSLKSYGEISEAHADDIKKLVPVFADLYASLSDEQKLKADTLFRRGGHMRSHKKMGSK